MSLYAIDKLIEETRRLAAEFRATTGTMLPVSGEIARYDVAQLLGLELLDSTQHGGDAIGSGEFEGLRVQVKGRVLGDAAQPSGQRIGQINIDGDWDVVALSIMDEAYAPREIYLVSREALETAMRSGGKRNRRGAITVAKFMIIGELVWMQETGRMSCDSIAAYSVAQS